MRKRVLIIAEAGVNHNGDILLAKSLVKAAADAGADYVKFQTFKAENLVTKNAQKADYQKENVIDPDNSQLGMLKKLELSEQDHYVLIEECKKNDIKFLSTAFDLNSLDFLISLNPDLFKIPSGEITNLPYLRKIGKQGKKIVLSTGLSTLEDIENALNVLIKSGAKKEDITILHCNTSYPTPIGDVNLSAMNTIANRFKVDIGYSDHTLGIEVPVAAVALGATIIEKHFTTDKNLPGPDHKASLNSLELKEMVRQIRNIELAMGTGIKAPTESEMKNMLAARKSIVAIKHIKKGELFTEVNIGVKRPGNGISPMRWDEVIGNMANKDYEPDDLILPG